MKFFNRNGKFNWIDDNNVFVGFNSCQDCCEQFGFMLEGVGLLAEKNCYDSYADHRKNSNEDLHLQADFPGFDFDTEFFERKNHVEMKDSQFNTVKFRLVHWETGAEMFLTLFNLDQTCYSHGFNVTKVSDDGIIRQIFSGRIP